MLYRIAAALFACALFTGAAQASHIVLVDGSSVDGLVINPDATNHPLMVQTWCGPAGAMIREIDRNKIDWHSSQIVAGEDTKATQAQADGAQIAAKEAVGAPDITYHVFAKEDNSRIAQIARITTLYQREMARIAVSYDRHQSWLADLSLCPTERAKIAIQRHDDEEQALTTLEDKLTALGFNDDDVHNLLYDLGVQ